MATIVQEVEAGALAFIISESNANQATIETWLGSGEAEVKFALSNLVKSIPSVKGIVAVVAGPIEAAVESAVEKYVEDLIAKETPQTLFSLYIALLTKLQLQVNVS